MRSENSVTVAIFVRALGLVYAVAIGSLWLQIDGLIGSDGILPFADYLAWIERRFGDRATWMAPTLLWVAPVDGMLHGLCALGMALACVLMAGFVPVVALVGAWAVYLSLTVAGQTFLGFQWDNLLLEVGFLSIILVAPVWRLGRGEVASRFGVFLFRWLVFRLMLGSGLVKLASGDPAWWPELTALTYHYETTCLPVWIGWYAHRAPLWVHQVSCALVLLSELVVPFFVFGPVRFRRLAFWVFLVQQLGIAATGNYGFFNILTVTACLLLLDDGVWPRAWRRETSLPATAATRVWFGVVAMPVGACVLVVSAVILQGQVDRALERFGQGFEVGWPAPVERVVAAVRPFRSANAYGLFARMTKHRPEIVVEGTADGRTWKPYAFRWKPGALDRRPTFVAPHQPRLDWQMWFAALGTEPSTPWFRPFLSRLLTGTPAVLGLLGSNPFPDAPPRAVRAVRYTYRYDEGGAAWWRREPSGLYAGPFGAAPSLDGRTGRR